MKERQMKFSYLSSMGMIFYGLYLVFTLRSKMYKLQLFAIKHKRVWVIVEGKRSRVRGRGSRFGSRGSEVEGRKSRVKGCMSRV